MMLSVVIPVFNEGSSVVGTVNRVLLELKKENVEHEVLIVNDGSTDDTSLEISRNFAKSLIPNLIIINHQHNLGYGAAIKSGIMKARGDLIGILDADETYDLQEFVGLVNHFNRHGFDMVVGQRKGRYYQGSFSKRLLRALLKQLVQFMTGRKVPDINSGSRIFRRSLAVENLDLLSDKFSFTTSITLVFMMRNAFVDYVPISYHPRIGKSKVKIVRDSVKTLGFVLTVSLYFNPLRIFAPLSLLFFLLSVLGLLVGSIIARIEFILVSAMFASVAAIIFAIGLLAHLFGEKVSSIAPKH